MTFLKALRAEFLKLKHSKVTWISAAAYVLIAVLSWFVLWMIQNPEAAKSLGLLGQKASILSMGISADWEGLFSFMAQMSVMGGMILFSFIVIYVYGREYLDGTAKNMLGLPMGRWNPVVAKLLVASLWYTLLCLFFIAEGFAVGALLGFDAPSLAMAARMVGDTLLSVLLVLSLQPLVAWITVASGGYLAPLGYTIGTLIVGNLMIRTDWARWCPWSIIALLSGMTGPREQDVLLGSAIVLAMTFALGLTLTILHQERADNCQ
jgi:ABC-2 type transport system permease protein